jgi:hypothetical protein
MDVGQPERRTGNYLRHGTLDLFAALNVATGKVIPDASKSTGAQISSSFCATSTNRSTPN